MFESLGVDSMQVLELLSELYFRTRRHLTGEDASHIAEQESRQRREEVRQLAGRQATDNPWWDKQLSALPASYLLSVSPERICDVLQQLRQIGPQEATAWFRYSEERKVSMYMIGTHESITSVSL